jgi:hemolysin activation/secretion protein
MTRRAPLLAAAWCGFAPLAIGPAWAQPTPSAPGALESPRPLERPTLPPALPPSPSPRITLPPVPLAPEVAEPASGPTIALQRIELSGNTVFGTDELRAAVFGAYEGRRVPLEALESIRRALTAYYVDRKYINSGALIPDQDVADGVVRMTIVEGRLTQVRVTGTRRLDPEYLRSRIALAGSGPLNLQALHDRLAVLRQDPQIAAIQAELRPGLAVGESILVVQVEENEPLRAAFAFGNNRSPSVGANRGELTVGHANLTGAGDALSLRLGKTLGLTDGAIAYSRPLDASDTTLTVRADRSSSMVIESPFRDARIESRIETVGIGLSRPVLRTPTDQVTLGAMLDRRDSRTSLLGEPFSFAPGVQDGVAKVTALRLSQDWLRRGTDSVMAARSSLAFGLPALGATRNEQGPDGRFVTWLAQGQWLRRWPSDVQAIVRGDLQLASHALLPSEKLAIGGASTVRGYRENQLVRDAGTVISAELRIPIGTLAVPGLSAEGEGRLEFAPFVDAGWAWNKGQPVERLTSVGAGLRWRVSRTVSAEVYKGFALRKIDQPANTLQDRGIHFMLVWQPY